MTSDINEWWGITVSHGVRIAPKQWRATARAFRRDTFEQVGNEFVGLGTTMNTADDKALQNGRSYVLPLGKPADWNSEAS
jgi:hypothetical protein